MQSEWPKTKLSDVIEIISGGTPKTNVPDYWGGEIPWLSVADFNKGYRWVSTAGKSVTERGVSESATTILKQGDIIVSARGTVGVLAQLAKPMAFNQSCYGIRGKDGISDTNFLYFALQYAVSDMKQNAHGGVFDTITRDTFKLIELYLPSLPEQRAIAHILGTLDDKIELNRKMNETLEAMAMALFKSWFVDFDPVRAKMEGRWKKSESLPGLPAELYDEFSGESSKGEFGNLSDFFDVKIGRTPPRKEQEWFSTNSNDIPWISIRDLGCAKTFISCVSEYLTREAVDKFRVPRIPEKTVVLSFKLTVGRVAITDREMLSNEAIAHFTPKNKTYISNIFLYLYLKHFDYETLGSTSSIATAVNSQSIRSIPLLVPIRSVHDGFVKVTQSIFDKIQTLQFETDILETLRDTLLPKLISGQIRIKDAEKIVESHI